MELLRDHERAWVCIAAGCDSNQKNALITNLSASGALVRGTSPKKNDFLINFDVSPGTTLRLKAKIIWANTHQFGVKFVNPSVRELYILRSLVWAHRKEESNSK